MSDKKHYTALHSDFDSINDAQMDIFREVSTPSKSNGDRIRQMTDEELAVWLDNISGCSVCLLYNMAGECNKFRNSSICVEHKLKWLKQEDRGDD